MHILFLSYWYPLPPDNGSKLRIHNLLRCLTLRHEVSLITFADRTPTHEAEDRLASLCTEVQIVPRMTYRPNSLAGMAGLFNRTPRYLKDTFSVEMAKRIQSTLERGNYDLVIASQLGTACYQPYFPNVPAIFEEAEVGSYYDRLSPLQFSLGKVRHALTWLKHKRYLSHLIREFRACVVVSERERDLIASEILDGERLHVIPNFLHLEDYEGIARSSQPDSLIFTGSFRYPANHEAMVWFLSEVYPIVQRQVPTVSLTITGDSKGFPLPSATNLIMTGFVEDIRPLVASARLSIAPILSGGGSRLKILEAMALGIPVVSTPKGAEGLGTKDGDHLLIADTREAFAACVVRLLQDKDLWHSLSEAGLRFVEERHSSANVYPLFEDLVQRVIPN